MTMERDILRRVVSREGMGPKESGKGMKVRPPYK
jgi:hypothetical protein